MLSMMWCVAVGYFCNCLIFFKVALLFVSFFLSDLYTCL